MRASRAGWAAVLAAGVAATAGCGGPTAGRVAGTVTFAGRPVEQGAITFAPADGKGATAGGPIEGGKYDVDGVPPGAVKVTINGTKVVGQKKVYDTPDSPVRDVTAELLPAKYNQKSELALVVKPGPNEKDFTLTK